MGYLKLQIKEKNSSVYNLYIINYIFLINMFFIIFIYLYLFNIYKLKYYIDEDKFKILLLYIIII